MLGITIPYVQNLIDQGENSSVEFKSADARPDSIAREMVAFSNFYGGVIFVGVEDNGSISGIGEGKNEEWISNIARNNIMPAIVPETILLEIDKKKILVITIAKGNAKPYQTIDGKFWMRIGSTNRIATKEELSRLFQQAGLVHFDISPVERTRIESLNVEKLREYWETYYQIPYSEMNKIEQERLLCNADILVDLEGKSVASVGGLLLFGIAPQRYLPQSTITFAVFHGKSVADELLNKKEIVGTIPELIDNTVALIQLFIPVPSEIIGMKREEFHNILPKVLREAIVNAVCHRDYSIVARKITIYIFNDRIEITSPGRIANTLTLEKIRYGNSALRNHFLMKFLDNMRYSDGLGRGIPMMIREMRERIEFEEIGELFKVTLWK